MDKKVEKKEHKIKKIIYEGDCSINSNSDEEQYIRKFERQSRRSNGIANYRKEAEENNKTKENSEWKNKTKDEISNAIPPKNSNDNKEEDKCKTESPKKTVTLNENLNTSYHANTQSNVNNSIEQKFTDRCYICDGKFHIGKFCPFGNRQPVQNNYRSNYTRYGGRQRSESVGAR